MSEEFLEEISKLDWKSLGKRMNGMAIYWLEHTFGDPNPKLPRGYNLDDIMQDSLERAMNKNWEGNFDKKKFENYLFGAIRSIVSNLAGLSDNKLTDKEYFNRTKQSDDGEEINAINQIPENDDFDIYDRIDKKIAFEKLEEEIKGEPELETILTAMRLGLKPREIADEMGKEPKEIYNLQRQLFGRAEKIGKSLLL